jgi:hypothetical protein
MIWIVDQFGEVIVMLDLSQEPQTQHVSNSMKRDRPKDDDSIGESSPISALLFLIVPLTSSSSPHPAISVSGRRVAQWPPCFDVCAHIRRNVAPSTTLAYAFPP